MYDYDPTHCHVSYTHISHNLHRLALDAFSTGCFNRYEEERDAYETEWSDALLALRDGLVDALLFKTATDVSYEVTRDAFDGHVWRITAFDTLCLPMRHRCYDNVFDFIRDEAMDNVTVIGLHIVRDAA